MEKVLVISKESATRARAKGPSTRTRASRNENALGNNKKIMEIKEVVGKMDSLEKEATNLLFEMR